jgi:general secretion pathway protein A
MYESFYGLTDKPFQLNPDPSFYFGSSQHRRAMSYLEYGVHRNEGFIVITGEIGAGKTTLVRSLCSKLDPNQVVAANLVSTQLDADDTLRMVASAFGIPSKHTEKSDLLLSIEAFLLSVARDGKRCLLIVDEAQNLTPRAVEELRMLSNFQIEQRALLQSFLIGQPEFRHILQSPQMKQLRQRVIAACHIGPMNPEETRGYIEHRLHHVGWKDFPHFSEQAFEAIHDASRGVPRRINSVCDRLLLYGFLSDKKEFAHEDVEEVVSEMEDETIAPPRTHWNTTSGDYARILNPEAFGDIDLSQMEIGFETADEAQRIIAKLSDGDMAARIMRIESSISKIEQVMLRINHDHTTLLALLDRLAVRLMQRSENDRTTS